MAGLRLRALRLRAGEARGSIRVGSGYVWWSLLWLGGHALGGAALGAAAGWMGSRLPPQSAPWCLVVVCSIVLMAALHQLGIVRLVLPHVPRQVPRGWVGILPWDLVAVGYGLQLGCALATRIRLGTTYAAIACAALGGSSLMGAVVMGAFGLARALPAVLLGPRVAIPERSLAMAARLSAWSEAIGKVNGLVLAAAFVALAAALVP